MRRWFQFQLRTLLILVALVAPICAWVRYSLIWIDERHRLLNRHEVHGLPFSPTPHLLPPAPRAPGGLWLFGESGVRSIGIFDNEFATPEAVAHLRSVFPEAEILND